MKINSKTIKEKRGGAVGLFCLGMVVLASCADKDVDRPNLYSVDSLLTSQARYLSENKASLQKIMTLDEAGEEITVTPKDAAAWEKELEIFEALEIINKPINMDLYRSEYLADPKSNLNIKAITTQADLPVTYMKVYYQNTTDRVRKIEAEYHESNSLYRSARRLTLEFTEVGSTPVLTAYSVEGDQKMFLSDTVKYSIEGALTIPN